MRRKLVLIPLLTFTLICGLRAVFQVNTAEAGGTIYIRADGSIDGPANITTVDKVTYTFNESNYDEIVVERDNIIIDGRKYKLEGKEVYDSKGLDLTGRSNVTIRNVTIRKFFCGIQVENSSHITISQNNITGNSCAIALDYSSNNSISGNNLVNNTNGVLVDSSSDNNSVSGNNITANNYMNMGIRLGGLSSNNTVSENNVANNDEGIIVYNSTNNRISGNTITNNGEGIFLTYSSNNSVSENYIANNEDGICLWRDSLDNIMSENNIVNNGEGICIYSGSSNNTVSGNVFVNDGLFISRSYGSVVWDNIVNGKPLVYLENFSNIIVGDAAGQVILVKCNNITIQNLNLSNIDTGIQLRQTNNTKITKNNITANSHHGISLWCSSKNTVTGNSIISNSYYGIWLYESSSNIVTGNNIAASNVSGILLDSSSKNSISENNISHNNYTGIEFNDSPCNSVSENNIENNSRGIDFLHNASYNSVFENNIADNDYGIYLNFYEASNPIDNKIYHNSFIGNIEQAYTHLVWHNTWDNGYPSGGNYWSDYTGTDYNQGSEQDIGGSDGTGDTEYSIDVHTQNIDHYPLMGMFSDFKATSEYHVQTICNSSITDFQYNGTAISFNVAGEDGTDGFCRVCVPKALMNDTFEVFVNGTEILPSPEPLQCSNMTHNYLHFNYTHSTQEIVIIPEFPSLLILPLFMIATLLAVTVYKRKHIVW